MPSAEFLIVTDLHADNGHQLAKVEPESGLTDRLIDAGLVIQQANDYAIKHGITEIFFAGDLTHKKAIDTPTAKFLLGVFNSLEPGTTWHFLFGNHDRHDASGLHATPDILQVLGKRFQPFTDPEHAFTISVSGGALVTIWPLPYDSEKRNIEQIEKMVGDAGKALPFSKRKGAQILLMHNNIIGAITDTGWESPTGIPIEALKPFDAVFSGHYHNHQVVRESEPLVVYVGSPLMLDFGDRDQERGFIHVKCGEAGAEYQRVLLDGLPRFYNVSCDLRDEDVDEFDADFVSAVVAQFVLELDNDFDGDYVKVIWKGTAQQLGTLDFDAVAEKLAFHGAKGVKQEQVTVPIHKARIEIKSTMSLKEMAERYASSEAISTEGLDLEMLMRINAELMESA